MDLKYRILKLSTSSIGSHVDLVTQVNSTYTTVAPTYLNSTNSSAGHSNFTTSAPYVWSVGLTAVFATDVLLFIAAVLLHFLGIFLIWKTKARELSNQGILLIHLSLTSIFSVVLSFMAVYYKACGVPFAKTYIFWYFVAYISYILSLLYLALDRLLFVVLALKYQRIITREVIAVALTVLWNLAFSYGIAMKYGGLINNIEYNDYAPYVYNGFVTLFTMGAYLFIIVKMFLSGRAANLQSSSRANVKRYIVPFLIVGTFFLFNVVPHAITTQVNVHQKYKRKFVIGFIGVNILNNISDPVIYIFLQPKVRKRFFKYVRNIFLHLFPCCLKKEYVDRRVQFRREKAARIETRNGTSNTSQNTGTFVDINLPE